ncbi:MAG: cyclopropane fatty acyl phospholipid synthase, partial [Halothiobacillus sp.]|nr:cyclopropane fatty acyl phospholipid synthase [Halothiobacillus sp.]
MTKQTVSPTNRNEHGWSEPNRERIVFTELLERAGIQLDGHQPWDLRLKNPRAVGQILGHGNLGLGESYMANWVDIPAVDQFIERVMRAQLDIDPTIGRSWPLIWHALKARVFNRQSPVRAWAVGQRHYDLGNEFYRDMLDARMTYTCGYWAPGVTTLDEAQEAKLDLICRKLDLQPGQRVLDIGCGWGSFMRFAAERYGVSCVGVTISKEQAEYGRQLCAGLPVEFRLQDYRDIHETFDHIVSVGMFEHVVRKNYATYMGVARRCLKPEGLFLLHTIAGGGSHSSPDPWIDKYIFPNGETPSH